MKKLSCSFRRSFEFRPKLGKIIAGKVFYIRTDLNIGGHELEVSHYIISKLTIRFSSIRPCTFCVSALVCMGFKLPNLVN